MMCTRMLLGSSWMAFNRHLTAQRIATHQYCRPIHAWYSFRYWPDTVRAYLLTMNVVINPLCGKIFFAIGDIIVGLLLMKILRLQGLNTSGNILSHYTELYSHFLSETSRSHKVYVYMAISSFFHQHLNTRKCRCHCGDVSHGHDIFFSDETNMDCCHFVSFTVIYHSVN